ncbi:MAG: DUF3336 domain-containing protein [Oceanococcaceae bacterium]
MVRNRRFKRLHRDWQNAPDYATWLAMGAELDEMEGRSEWRYEDASSEYDYRMIRGRLDELRRLREDHRVRELVFVLHEGLHGNLGNIANPSLYAHCRAGTKILLESYLNEVAICLNYLCDNDFEDFPLDEKVLFFKRTGSSFGRSALMLSGGATLGMFHLGVIKALWQERLLPRVITGSSAGSIIAGMVGTRLDEEMNEAFHPGGMYLEAWRTVDLRTAWKRRAFMDPVQLEACLASNMGEYTFEEAFNRTRRIVGITVSPVDAHQQGRLMNYLSAPNVLMRRASLASCSIPGVFPAVSLLAKNYRGETVGYMPQQKWQDGSLRSDLPMLRLARLHNVNHYIVSQTNPHVVPFMRSERKRLNKGRGVGAFASELARSSLQVYSKHVMETARDHMDPEGFGRILEKVHAITTQRYSGDVTIFPRQPPKKLLQVMSNPTDADIQRFIADGERRTWPQIERIRNSTVVSRTFEACLQRMKDRGVTRTTAAPGKVIPITTRTAAER